MSRYTIDGQILSDMAGAIRTKKYGVDPIEKITAYATDLDGVSQVYEHTTQVAKSALIIDSVDWGQSEEWGFFQISDGKYNSTQVRLDTPYELPMTISISGDWFQIRGSYAEVTITATLVGVDENDEPLTYTPEEMVAEINALPQGLSEEDLLLTGAKSYAFSYGSWNWFIEKFGNQITTKDISDADSMFYFNETLTNIPFDINCSSYVSLRNMFNRCRGLTAAPNIHLTGDPTNMDGMFNDSYIKTIPADMGTGWDWAPVEAATTAYKNNMSAMFKYCYALLNVPSEMIGHTNLMVNGSYSIYYSGFQRCYNLEEINGLCVPYNASWSSNSFNNTFTQCERLKDVIFKTQEDGTPFVASGWKNQVIDLTTVGFGSNCKSYNSDLTNDTKVDNMTKWSRLANNSYGGWPNYWTDDVKWSVYGRDSAIRTINSLPDVSGSGSTNTIKFNANGAKSMGITDGSGKSIAELSDAEIAVAAAKGWTVTLV